MNEENQEEWFAAERGADLKADARTSGDYEEEE